jgi:uncharacterized protein
MKLIDDGNIRLSATDLASHLACHHLTALDVAAVQGELEPPPWHSPVRDAIQERGLEHEARYLEHLRAAGRELLDLTDTLGREEGARATEEAMRSGAPAIVQPTLAAEGWLGVADVLLRVETPSELGDWSYEVVDTKLARETSGGAILQLCLYSELVGKIQGALPARMHVVSPGRDFEPRSYRVLDYLAYYRWVKQRLVGFVGEELGGGGEATYPDPVSHCDVCRWFPVCDRRRRADDHLSLVAGISKLQIGEFQAREVSRLETLAQVPLPLSWKPDRGSVASYERAREQARVQLQAREEERPVFELLPREAERGLARLPAPSPEDIFFDIEGDSFAEEGGREYLFGWAFEADGGGELRYESLWALEAGQERAMFEHFVAEVMRRWAADPGFHVYHYAPYEPTALKRLMGRYGVCEDEIDRMLRAGVFVDLYSVARQAILAGVESYSIKKLEPLFGYVREENLQEVRGHMSDVERALELQATDGLPPEVLRAVETYSRDDCAATLRLRDWLESLRTERVEAGEEIPRPEAKEGEPSEKVTERKLAIDKLADELLVALPDDPDEWTAEHWALWLLAHMLEWHWREEKVSFWEYYRLAALDEAELLDEKYGVSGLRFESVEGGTARCPIHRYSYPLQEFSLKVGNDLHAGETRVGKVAALDLPARRLDVKKTQAAREIHPEAVFAHDHVSTPNQADAMLRLGRWVADHGIDADGPHRAARDLLLGLPPRFAAGAAGLTRGAGEETVEYARRLARELDDGALPVQGPPGSGKTFSGARMICELVAAGKKVGITSNSHKVIRHLLEEVVEAAAERGTPLTCVEKVKDISEEEPDGILEVRKNGEVLEALQAGAAQVAAGTAWLWSREELLESVDVLFVDEAGQMSLANTLAVAQAGRSLVLLGDPQQLEQPQQGSHPEGSGVSALEHILGESDTIADDRGLFLPETWRLHPALAEFTSEVFYDGRLSARPELERQRLELQQSHGIAPFDGAGLWFVPVAHAGNQSSSREEVEVVAGIVERLTGSGSSWTDKDGERHLLGLDEVLIVAPFNAQVALLQERLGREARVGTVDKFQGQEAPVVLYSLTTSTAEEAPRGMEFLYSLNRLNVATSRARCACILVGSALLFEPDCRSPRQMELANAFCRYLEMAEEVSWPL